MGSRLLRVRQSRLTLKPATRSTTSRQKSKIKKAFLQINNVSSSLVNSWKMGALSRTTIFKKSRHCTWCCGCEVGVDAKRAAYHIWRMAFGTATSKSVFAVFIYSLHVLRSCGLEHPRALKSVQNT